MTKNRLEAFSDGVLAIIITIMVLELKVPHTPDINALQPLIPVLLSYVLSFLYIGIYWNNHHHLLHAAKKVNGGILWANLHLLFWLSLFPFVTGWMGENHFEQTPTLIYGTILLLAAIAYYILQTLIVKTLEKDSLLIKAIGKDIKGKASPILYLTAILLVFVSPLITQCIYVLVALIWLVPDKRIEKIYYDSNHKSQNKIIE
ncbi:MAG TPA: TMEM175 family protein [Ignavibacteriaceae bacterium]